METKYIGGSLKIHQTSCSKKISYFQTRLILFQKTNKKIDEGISNRLI